MSRKKKEGMMSVKPVRREREEVLYEPRHDGIAGSSGSSSRRHRRSIRDSWHPEAIPDDALDMPSEPNLTLDELELVKQIASRAR